MLHGAGGSADRFFQRFGTLPDEAGLPMLFVDSRARRGMASAVDSTRRGFSDRALEKVFGMVAVDPNRLALGGFPDGATYALRSGSSTAISFPQTRRVLARLPRRWRGARPARSSHTALPTRFSPIDHCSRVIVPELKKRGYDVTFREFEGGHEVPRAIAADGFSFVRAS